MSDVAVIEVEGEVITLQITEPEVITVELVDDDPIDVIELVEKGDKGEPGGGGSGGAVASVNSQTGAVVLGLVDLADDATHRTVTDAEKAGWSGKQDALGYIPVPAIRTVAGKPLSADVTLGKGDVGLSNVDNTADADKPVSTAVATALGLKADAFATASGTAYLDFGSAPGAHSATVDVTGQAGILATHKPSLVFQYGVLDAYSAEEAQLLSSLVRLQVSVPAAGVGFTIYGFSDEEIEGRLAVGWRW